MEVDVPICPEEVIGELLGDPELEEVLAELVDDGGICVPKSITENGLVPWFLRYHVSLSGDIMASRIPYERTQLTIERESKIHISIPSPS